MASEINVLANSVGFRAQSATVREAQPSAIRTLPVIDNSVPSGSNIRTSVDCYVTGQYVQRNGKALQVHQRYTVFISYGKDTQMQTMRQLNERIAADFQERYGGSFNITTVFVPDIPRPITGVVPGVPPGEEAPIEFYEGSRLFKEMHNYERLRLDIAKEHLKERLNVQSLRQRYGYGRRR